MSRLEVVIIDDVEDLRTSVRMVLEMDPRFEVVGEAGDGQAGIEVARDTDPHLILVDLSMPKMDGLEALPLLREACPDATLVVFTGFMEPPLGEQVRQRGAAGYIEKGISPEDLVTELWALAGHHLDGGPAEADDAAAAGASGDIGGAK